MILDPILPEIATFIDFTTHNCYSAKKKGYNSYSTHLAGDIPKEHPMPYNVYVILREYLEQHSDAVDELVKYLKAEFEGNKYDFTSVKVDTSIFSHKKSFGRTKEYPQIDVTLEW